MSIQRYLTIGFIGLLATIKAQDIGKVVIKNGSDSYPKFIVSLNGIRPTNEYTNSVTFDYLDEYNYKINILQAGSRNTLSFMVYSAPNYISTYVIKKDNYGNFLFNQESRRLIGDSTVDSRIISGKVADKPSKQELEKEAPATASASATGEVIDEGEYFDIVRTLKKEPVEKNRLEMAKTFFANKWFLSSMVKDALKMFNLERSRVDFAKFAYTRTVDKQNFFKVFDAFTLSNSKKDMNEFIKTNP